MDKLSLTMLLWKDELLSLLSDVGELQNLKNKPKRVLWSKLANSMDVGELREAVRVKLKARKEWRVAQQP
ncbi:hypothetical protein NQB68_13300 [Escherichia coli]|nr:hypothetical protein NQB68_13300 [Escherichia coli]